MQKPQQARSSPIEKIKKQIKYIIIAGIILSSLLFIGSAIGIIFNVYSWPYYIIFLILGIIFLLLFCFKVDIIEKWKEIRRKMLFNKRQKLIEKIKERTLGKTY